jgi:hypothetical protein
MATFANMRWIFKTRQGWPWTRLVPLPNYENEEMKKKKGKRKLGQKSKNPKTKNSKKKSFVEVKLKK